MEFLKDIFSADLYSRIVEEIKGREDVKLANLAEGKYVGAQKYISLQKKLQNCAKREERLREKIYKLEQMRIGSLQKQVSQLEEIQFIKDLLYRQGNKQLNTADTYGAKSE